MCNIKIENTIKKYGYNPDDLKKNSEKLVIWFCSICKDEKDKKYRLAKKNTLCLKCSNKINANTNTNIRSEKIKEWHKSNEHPLKGKPRSQETKDKISKSQLESDYTCSEETRQKLSKANSGVNNPMYGKKHTEEALEKMKIYQNENKRTGKNCNFYGQKYSLDRRYSLDDVRKLSNHKHCDIYHIPEQDYTDTKSTIKIFCKICNDYFYQVAANHIGGCGCNKCNMSKGEIVIENILNEKNIPHIRQMKFDKCKYKRLLPFDFYLPNHNICIEFDGEQHFIIKEIWGGVEELKKIQKRDKIKTDYCYNNGITLIRIKYDENIVEKLTNVL